MWLTNMSITHYSFISWLHIATALVAMALGIWVLAVKKGTALHKKLGYSYALAMVLVNATAFGIYHLMGKFGPFHLAALVSIITLIAGLIPAMKKQRAKNWRFYHLTYMYWSVIGLYAAFFSELAVRIKLSATFGMLVFSATFITIAIGFIGHWYLVKKWKYD